MPHCIRIRPKYEYENSYKLINASLSDEPFDITTFWDVTPFSLIEV
jgi:hypothetical protein